MAQADYFLKIDGIPGESKDSKHKDEIELVSFSWGVSNVHGYAGGAAGASSRPDFQDFHFTRPVDKASPQLFLACASGKHIKEANLSVRRAGKSQLEYLKIKFSDVLVTSIQDGAGGGDVAQESVALAFSRIDYEYHQQVVKGAPAGAVNAGWDLAKNAKV